MRLFFIGLLLSLGLICQAATLIFQSDSEKMYFYPEYSNAFNYSDGRKGYTVQIRRAYTVTQNGVKYVDLILEFNSDWSQVRIMKWFYNDANNQLVAWETTNPQPWKLVQSGTVAGNIRDGVKKFF